MGTRIVKIVHAAHHLDVEYLKYIMHAGINLPIGLRPHDIRRVLVTAVVHEVAGEVHQAAVAGILLGIVLVGKGTIEHVETETFAPFELTEQRDAVEDTTVEVPEHHERRVAVVEELHVAEHGERAVVEDVRLVTGWHDE